MITKNLKEKITPMNSPHLSKFSSKEFLKKKFYTHITRKEVLYKCNQKNIVDIPKLKKIVISCTSNLIIQEKQYMIPAVVALEMITGQKAVHLCAKKSIAAFKIRQHTLIGCKVTLRGETMHAFLEKLHTVILPRLRDTQKYTIQHLDTHGNFSIGCNNIFVFPEIENHFDEFESIQGWTITLTLSSLTKNEGCCFLSSFAFPFASSV